MTTQAISQLTVGTPPYPAGTLFEISVPNGSGGYNTVKGQLSDILASGTQVNPFIIDWDSNTPVVAGNSVALQSCPWTNATVLSCVTSCTGGTFTVALTINGVTITGLGAVPVSSTPTTTTATGSNTMTLGAGPLSLAISGVTGSPVLACIQLNLQIPA